MHPLQQTNLLLLPKMEELNIESLIRRIDMFKHQEEMETLTRLDAERAALNNKVKFIQNIYVLLKEAQSIETMLHQAIGKFRDACLDAERQRLRYWGINMERTSYCTPGQL